MNKRELNRVLLQSAMTLGLASIKPALVMADSQTKEQPVRVHIDPPSNDLPQTLEQRIERRTSFVLIGTFRRFLYVPEAAYKDYYNARYGDADYLRLKKENATDTAFEQYYKTRPVNVDAFRLRGESEITGDATTFLEFELEKVLFKRAEPSTPRMGPAGKYLYFTLGSRLQMSSKKKQDWQSYIGRRVVMLSGGANSLSAGTYIPYAYPVHFLPGGNHYLDSFPITLSELSRVDEIAQRLGLVRVDKP